MSFSFGHGVDNTLVNQQGAFGDVSNRYIATSTTDIITELNKYSDFKPVGFDKATVRKAEKEGYQKHMVMLEDSNSEMLDGTNMRIVLFNSNDRSTSMRLYVGAYRDACANDCVFGDDIMEPIFIRHTKKDWKHSIWSLMSEYENIQKKTETMIDTLMNTYFSYGDIGRLSERVVDNLMQDITGKVLDPLQLNVAHRTEDTGKDAWSTYNRIQYNLLQGGVDRIISKTEDGHLFETMSKTHIVTNDQRKIELNRGLHNMIMKLVA